MRRVVVAESVDRAISPRDGISTGGNVRQFPFPFRPYLPFASRMFRYIRSKTTEMLGDEREQREKAGSNCSGEVCTLPTGSRTEDLDSPVDGSRANSHPAKFRTDLNQSMTSRSHPEASFSSFSPSLQ